jgi:hypothetical protein
LIRYHIIFYSIDTSNIHFGIGGNPDQETNYIAKYN